MWHSIGLRVRPTRLSWLSWLSSLLECSHFHLQFRVRLFQSTNLLLQHASSGNHLLKLVWNGLRRSASDDQDE
jgi:hypothetical protein